MTKVFTWSQFRHCRIWLDELPQGVNAGINVETITIASNNSNKCTRKVTKLALEMFYIGGPKSLYALLGGEMHYSTAPELNAVILHGSQSGDRYESTLVGGYEAVRAELPFEYLDGVLCGLREGVRETAVHVGGRLSITVAAHGEIGSSLMFFKHAAACLILLSSNTDVIHNDHELQNILEIKW